MTGIAASVLLGLTLAGSTVADVETTVSCNVSGRCQELNPILMGMARDRGSLYAVKRAGRPVVMDVVGKE